MARRKSAKAEQDGSTEVEQAPVEPSPAPAREPVQRVAIARDEPARRAGGWVLTERGWRREQ